MSCTPGYVKAMTNTTFIGSPAWLQCDMETTGLDENGDYLLELVLILTDEGMNEIDRVGTLVRPDEETWARLHANPYVESMHRRSGLIEDLTVNGSQAPTLDEVNHMLGAWVAERIGPAEVHFSGGGVANFDWPWAKRHLPAVADQLHYRPLDFSIVAMAIARARKTDVLTKAGDKAHRALADIEEDLVLGRRIWALLRTIDLSVLDNPDTGM